MPAKKNTITGTLRKIKQAWDNSLPESRRPSNVSNGGFFPKSHVLSNGKPRPGAPKAKKK